MSKLDSKNAPGHQVLAAAGKKALRPGGFGATERLFKFAEFRRGETVLELASALATRLFDWQSAMAYMLPALRKIQIHCSHSR
jgi:methyltransferase (EC 2.1.1.-)